MPLTNVAAATQILANALKALDSLREQSKGSKDSTLKENISRLYDNLLDLKAAVLRVQEENIELKSKIRELESPEAEPCPKCRKRAWQLERSYPDHTFGQVGCIRRVYKCSLCGFSEEKLLTPQGIVVPGKPPHR
jgi:hypothetical protein